MSTVTVLFLALTGCAEKPSGVDIKGTLRSNAANQQQSEDDADSQDANSPDANSLDSDQEAEEPTRGTAIP